MNAEVSTTNPEAPEQKLYSATLVNGQTYFSRGVEFTFGQPRVVDEDHYRYLRAHAVKSVLQGTMEDGDARRVKLPYFEFKRVRSVIEDDGQDHDDDDDELEEVSLTSGQLRSRRLPPQIREDAVDVDNDMSLADLAGKPRKRPPASDKPAEASAPGARSRARSRSR